MRKKTKWLILALVNIIVVTSLAGCGGKSESNGEKAVTEEKESISKVGSNGEKAVEANEMYDSITVAQNQDITSMNPWVAANTSYDVICPEIYETLGAYDSFGGTFQGVLMSDWKQIDEKTYNITLYEGIYDSAGNPFTASDVVFSCKRCWEKGELVETQIVESVTAIDDYNVEFVFKENCGIGDFESVMYGIYMVTEASYTASQDEMVTTPVGTGPYKLKEYVTGSAVTIEATENYWQKPEMFVVPTQYSNVKTIRCEVISESSQLATALQTGTIAVSDSIEGESADEFLTSDDYGTYVYADPNGRTLMANMSKDSEMSDENLRKAVFYAIDQEAIMAFVNGGNTEALATFGSVSYSDYNPAWNDNNFTYDLDKAKEYLAQSAYPDGCTLVMNVIAGREADAECALVLQQQLAEIGIELEVNTYQIAQYLPLEGDSSAWDISASGFPTFTGYLVNSWQKYFDRNTIGGDTTKNFMADDNCQTLIDACLNPETYGEDSCNAFVQYLQDNAVCKGLYAPARNMIYNKSIVESVVLSQSLYVVPGAFTYAQ